MIKEKTVEHIEANLASELTLKFTLRCQKLNMGCHHSRDVEYAKVVTPATAAEALYKEGWRVKEVGGQPVIFCSNCNYTDK